MHIPRRKWVLLHPMFPFLTLLQYSWGFVSTPEINPDILAPFMNCRTVITSYTTHHIQPLFPIILVSDTDNPSNQDFEDATIRSSLNRRRNPAQFCSASIFLELERHPESTLLMESHTLTYSFYHFIKAHSLQFPLSQLYIVWVTAFGTEFRKSLQHFKSFSLRRYNSIDMILVGLSFTGERDSVTFQHQNHYYTNITRNISSAWMDIHCVPGQPVKCFRNIWTTSETVSRLNKYFWSLEAWQGPYSGLYADGGLLYLHAKAFYRIYETLYVRSKMDLYALANLTESFGLNTLH